AIDRGGPVDKALSDAGGFRALCVYGARESLGRAAEQHLRWSETEQDLGLARTYQVEIADGSAADRVVAALRELPTVESAKVQTLATAPFEAAVAHHPQARALSELAWAPHERVRAPQAHALEAGDERVTVGLVDTGISIGHPEFQRKLLAGYDTVDLGVDEAAGLRLVGDSRGDDFTPEDEVGHGSHVGGVVGATGWELPPGIAGLSLMLPLRVLAAAMTKGAARPSGVGAEANINAGFKVAVDLGADVLNLSFGTSEHELDPDGPKPQAQVVAYAERYGCVLVAASGNGGVEERFYPAALPEVIAVGSMDDEGRRSSFSSFGDHVALSAPGERIVSAGITGIREGSGTSYAAPFVTGAAALVVAHARRLGRKLAPADVKELLVSTATPSSAAPAHEVGAGLLNIEAAIRKLDTEAAA
ncbi:MAG TPA: S8 family serine peptidase, partial [Gaiellaceae bacterium]|nr:S8 family serine peptidase [Gaiellaceae bacterium]